MAFDYKIPVPPTDTSCKSTFTQTFHHTDWIDGQDVVQAQPTPGEDGFNLRFHRIEQDIAALGTNLATAMSCIAVLRQQIVEVLGEIKAQFNLPPAKAAKEGKDVKDFKDGKDTKDGKDGKDGKDSKDTKDSKDGKDGKDGKDTKDAKDSKDSKDGKDGKDDKDGKEKEHGKELQWGAAEKGPHQQENRSEPYGLSAFLWGDEPPAAAHQPPVGRAFIRAEERPAVGERAIKGAEDANNG